MEKHTKFQDRDRSRPVGGMGVKAGLGGLGMRCRTGTKV